MVLRKASHAGSWYKGSEKGLLTALQRYFTDDQFGPKEEFSSLNKPERKCIGGVSPHAGMDYSGPCAAFTYLNLFKEKIPDTVIVLGTDHIGYSKVALMSKGEWETPLGNLKIDGELSNTIVDNSNIVEDDNSLFMGFQAEQEHNIEIQMPFIKYCSQEKDVKVVTIKISGTRDIKKLTEISNDVTKAIQLSDKDVVIVASSDMSHKSVNSTNDMRRFKDIDLEVINNFENLDPQKTLDAALRTTVCGPQTITTLMLICRNLNATRGELLKYYTSSEKTGSIGGYCVGYFSGVLIKE
ncbi:MAG: AmmeMemoRadiSam system protein B [Promethearchaeota archaeon]|jgi:AmmeMemoRadiSam system protein B